MSQLTRQDVAEVVEEVLGRQLGLKSGETLNDRLDKRFSGFESKMDKKLDDKFGFFVEHMDDKFDGLAEAISLIKANMGTLARQSNLDEVKEDVKTIKFAVKETNQDLHRLEGRFDRFECAFI